MAGYAWSVELSRSGGSFESENVLFEEALLDDFFKILLEGPVVDGLVSLAVIIRAIFFCSRK